MKLYFPESVLKLPFIRKAAEMLSLHAQEYDIPELDLKETVILDPVKNFLSLYLDKEKDINYFAQLFYSVKGTYEVIKFLYRYGFLNGGNNGSKVFYSSTRKLYIELNGIIYKKNVYNPTGDRTINNIQQGNEKEIIDFYSTEYINRFREFLKALLYFGSLEIHLDALVVELTLPNNGGIFGDSELFIIEKAE